MSTVFMVRISNASLGDVGYSVAGLFVSEEKAFEWIKNHYINIEEFASENVYQVNDRGCRFTYIVSITEWKVQ